MSNILGRLLVELGVNTSSFLTGMNAASKEAKKTGKDIEGAFEHVGDALGKALGSFGQVGTEIREMGSAVSEAFAAIGEGGSGLSIAIGAIAGLGVAAVGAAAGLAALAVEGSEVVERLVHISEKTGIGIRDLQMFEAAGKTVGVSLEDMVTGMRKFDLALTNSGKGTAAQTVLRQLGVTSHDSTEALLQVADAFQKMQDGPEKAADAVALFGKSGLNLIPILDKGRSGIQEFQDIVAQYGFTVSKEAVATTDEFKVATEKLSLAFDGAKVASVPVLGILSHMIETMAGGIKVATDFGEKVSGAVKPGIGGQDYQVDMATGLAIPISQGEGDDTGAKQIDEEKKLADEKRRTLVIQAEQAATAKAIYEVMKDGGQAAYALDQKKLELTDAIDLAGKQGTATAWENVAAIQAQIAPLQALAEAEKLRAENAKRLQETLKAIEASFNKGGSRPLQKFSSPRKGSSGGLFTLSDENPAPNINGLPEGIDATAPLVKPSMFATANKEAQDFLNDYHKEVSSTVANVNADYDRQLDHWKFLLSEQAVSQEQFTAISTAIEKRRLAGLVEARRNDGTSTFGDAWDAVFKHIEDGGRDMSLSLAADVSGAIDNLNQQLASLATGGGANLKKLAQSFEQSVVESSLKKLESAGASALGLDKLGIGGDKKPSGTSSDPLFVAIANSGGLPLGNTDALSGALKAFNPSSLFGGGGSSDGFSAAENSFLDGGPNPDESGSGGLFSKLGSLFSGSNDSSGGDSGGGGFLSGLASTLFGGFRADGGDVAAGKAYVVGENHPEIFVPGASGKVMPSVSTGNVTHNNLTQQFTVNTPDADSFRRSHAQIAADASRMANIALSRT